MLWGVPLTSACVTIEPLADIGIGISLITTALSILLAITRFLCIKAQCFDHVFSYQSDAIFWISIMMFI